MKIITGLLILIAPWVLVSYLVFDYTGDWLIGVSVIAAHAWTFMVTLSGLSTSWLQPLGKLALSNESRIVSLELSHKILEGKLDNSASTPKNSTH